MLSPNLEKIKTEIRKNEEALHMGRAAYREFRDTILCRIISLEQDLMSQLESGVKFFEPENKPVSPFEIY